MIPQALGHSGLKVSPIGFGAFKIGRNQNIKYAESYDLPDEAAAADLLNRILDGGVTLIDTAPAYGLSEERIGRAISHRRGEFVLSTKVGETFHDGRSRYDYSAAAVQASVHRSLRLLKTDVLDVVFIHSDGNDEAILNQTDAVETLGALKAEGLIKAVGLSGKTPAGARQALDWADAIMVEYHLDDLSHAEVLNEAAARGVGVIVKKGLAAGRLDPATAIRFVLKNPAVSSLVIGGLNPAHIQSNVEIARRAATE